MRHKYHYCTIFLLLLILFTQISEGQNSFRKVDIGDEFVIKIEKYEVVNLFGYNINGLGFDIEQGIEVTYAVYLFQELSSRYFVYVDLRTNEEVAQIDTQSFNMNWELKQYSYPNPVLLVLTDWKSIESSVVSNVRIIANYFRTEVPEVDFNNGKSTFDFGYIFDLSSSDSDEKHTIREEYSYYKSTGIIRYYKFELINDENTELEEVNFVFRNVKDQDSSTDLSFISDNLLVIGLVAIIAILVAFIIKRELTYEYYDDEEEEEYFD